MEKRSPPLPGETVEVVALEALLGLSGEILRGTGVPDADAATIAETLVWSDLRGVSSHGVARLPAYARRVEAGLINPATPARVIGEHQSAALIDAGNGFGQIAGLQAMSLAVEKARQGGSAAVGVRNSNHFGTAAYFALKAIVHDAIGLVVSNAAPAMAPWGGREPMLGTNPMAVAIPAFEERPIVLDMATSSVARGKIRLAAANRTPIPEGWATDREGLPTSDPAKALEGVVLPMGGPKGYGLALVIDVLCGILLGAAAGRAVKALDDLADGPIRAGHLFAALDIRAFMEPVKFRARVDEYVREVRSSPRSPGCERIFLPGEIEFETEEKRRRDGIPIGRAVLKELHSLREKYVTGRTSPWMG